jgi:hypothetical protein
LQILQCKSRSPKEIGSQGLSNPSVARLNGLCARAHEPKNLPDYDMPGHCQLFVTRHLQFGLVVIKMWGGK